ncbi:MAG: hypothetical protein NT083_13230 [Rhodocyclales bacterium]|nr:hypothetical protein [Rhodocyclales bacterium]
MEATQHREPWNKGKLIGQKPPLKPKDIWAIRIQLQNDHQVRDLAMFNLAIDSKLRGCDLVNLHVRDITHGNRVLARAMVVQRKTQRPVQFELTEPTRVETMAGVTLVLLVAVMFSPPLSAMIDVLSNDRLPLGSRLRELFRRRRRDH